MSNIELWKGASTLFLIAGIFFFVYAGYVFYENELYKFILLKSSRMNTTQKRRPKKAEKKKKNSRKKQAEKHISVSEDLSDGFSTMKLEEDFDGSSLTGGLDRYEEDDGSADTGMLEPEKEISEFDDDMDAPSVGTSLLTEKMRAAIKEIEDDTLWFKPAKGFYIKKSIMIIHTTKTINEEGEIA